MRNWILATIAVGLAAMQGCSPMKTYDAVPEELTLTVTVLGEPAARTWGGDVNEAYKQDLVQSVRDRLAYFDSQPGVMLPERASILNLSGGGEWGAYGAGVLCGWTARGDRPDFELVTGVSTGALISPMAFVGPEYDDAMRRVYTEVTSADIFTPKFLLNALRDDSLFDTQPLAALIGEVVDARMIERVAEEHRRGRRLLVATTSLNAERPVIWNMGVIANSDDPRAPDLFRDVLLASAAIPGAFTPVYFDVEAPDGTTYQELHVDGGVVSQVFLWGGDLTAQDLREGLAGEGRGRETDLYIIRNGTFAPAIDRTKPTSLAIAMRSITALITMQANADAYRLFIRAVRNGLHYNITWVRADFGDGPPESFDQAWMRRLFQYGYDRMQADDVWSQRPPYDPDAERDGERMLAR